MSSIFSGERMQKGSDCLDAGAASGYTLHMRQMDDRPESATIVQQFIGIVNHRNGAPPESASSGNALAALF